ncbi:MAG: glycoside hydrolase family 5 protein [Edaphobacter sp.]|uniref:glycoside hydrolase family 5 protein n=1 Tax=Edaphobacter sp. TaxID=1934404 RepID=UPI0023903B12|nr:glycoside hydrolase family 5 protein [Edaphobacter sp.]MDE1178743.1 glycoside hydrolase family 5 protein [Edaphobacter sp.]
MTAITAIFTALMHLLTAMWTTLLPSAGEQGFGSLSQGMRDRAHLYHARLLGAGSGYWHTRGNLILDQKGRAVRIQGINWYGFETVRKVPGGLTVQDYRTILQTVKADGFNTIRLPLSNDMVEHPEVPSAIAFTSPDGTVINRPLRGLNSLQILDRIVAYADRVGLKVILDNHRSEAGDSAQSSGLWYTPAYPESTWIADWQTLARRYNGDSTVIGVDLRNEPHNAATTGACWSGCDAAHDWHLAAERAGNSVLAINPRLIVFVEGTDAVNNNFYWWGGNLLGVKNAPVVLKTPNQLVYSAHLYGPSEYRQQWFNASTTDASLEANWNRYWGYISQQNIAPVWVGEFGTSNRNDDIRSTTPGSEGQWFEAMVNYFGRNREIGWSLWALNGEDPYGLLTPDYKAPVNPLKLAELARIMTSSDQSVMTVQKMVDVRATAGQTSSGLPSDARAIRPYRPHLPASVLRGNVEDADVSPQTRPETSTPDDADDH